MPGLQVDSSSSAAGTLIGVVIVWVISAGVTGLLAARKNRSVVGWAMLGGIFFPVTGLLILLLISHLCPKCQRPISPEESKRKACPRCRTVD